MVALGSLLVSGCGGTPAGGDPGGQRLKELGSDLVFSATPDGATMVQTTKTEAHYRKPGFSGGGWDGPTVVVTFTSSGPPADVYGFYAERAAAAGWQPTAKGAVGLTDRWAKTYSDGAAATLILALLSPQTASVRRYSLSGGVAPVVH